MTFIKAFFRFLALAAILPYSGTVQAVSPWNRTCINSNLSIEVRSIGEFAKEIRIQKVSGGPTFSPSGGFYDSNWQGLVLIFDSTACQSSDTFCNANAEKFSISVWNSEGQLVALPRIEQIQFLLSYRAHGVMFTNSNGTATQFVFGEFPATGDCEISTR